ncbi:MAG: hypothetical protein ACRDMX_02340 [Solirubrobacteraceae bacterium]
MRLRRATAAGTVIVLGAALTGCGAAGRPSLNPPAEASLRHELATVQAAAAGGDRSSALHALSAFQALVGRDAAAGQLSAIQRRALGTGIARTRARIEATIPASTSSSTTTTAGSTTPQTTAQPAPPSPKPTKHGGGPGGNGPPGHQPGHGHGHDHGHGGGGS